MRPEAPLRAREGDYASGNAMPISTASSAHLAEVVAVADVRGMRRLFHLNAAACASRNARLDRLDAPTGASMFSPVRLRRSLRTEASAHILRQPAPADRARVRTRRVGGWVRRQAKMLTDGSLSVLATLKTGRAPCMDSPAEEQFMCATTPIR